MKKAMGGLANAKPAPVTTTAKKATAKSVAKPVAAKASTAKTATAKTVAKAPAKSAAAPMTTKKTAAPVVPVAKPKASSGGTGLEFIGTFPLRKSGDGKKLDNKKSSTGPVFDPGTYSVTTFQTPLCETYVDEFKSIYMSRHSQDEIKFKLEKFPQLGSDPTPVTQAILAKILNKELDMLLLNMKDIPLDLPKGLTIGAAFKREDPRDVLVTRATYGAIQELPYQANIAANSKRRVMQIRALRPDLHVVSSLGNIHQRLDLMEKGEVDALLLSWSSLRRLNLSPRYYVSLQADLMVPAPCQGSVGVICRDDDESLLSKLRYVEDSEASWSSRCERAFLAKMGGRPGAPIGALAHRKGTQDPWILDIAVGDPTSGEVLKHREIGTSRCKPESLADKAFSGVLGKGARRFMYL
ncbi:MAG: hydroxymethylbilane synthase [Bdellovibrionota bacterium]